MVSWLEAAPRFLDPLLALVERIDRRLRRLRPIRSGGLLHLERRRHRATSVRLADGVEVRAGDPIGVLHFDNHRVRGLAAAGWQRAGYREARDDLAELAAWHLAQPAGQRPVAYCGVTVLAPLVGRLGFELRDRAPTPWARLEDWYLRSLLVRWAPSGRGRLRRGHRPLRARTCWLSAEALQRRYAQKP